MQSNHIDHFLISNLLPMTLLVEVILLIEPVMRPGVWQIPVVHHGQSLSRCSVQKVSQETQGDPHLVPTIVESTRLLHITRPRKELRGSRHTKN